ncbi:Uncharacterised protein [Candidatus Ornithobacterium hominis]|uniref:Bacterial mobilisation domain-containing protein n=1 Tax=Candidatus Ornithobacterium hominis TaxID=2497989 RepID=A0A383TWI8_9FLAO|nr:hypothetical protein [Candidatus Ornithobacterium hominis]MCT7904459.1 hypothetical protein [Candidatus Ornithobacterium hominis]CAI9430364.1 Mobilization protein [Candidatus Ornithobacterium hominis]SZD71356.1 Uncharacterised protein [Candidatus Ornithobacterium hominis]
MKNTRVVVRLAEEDKQRWVKMCEKRGISLTDLVISSVEEKMMKDEKLGLMKFIELQDNYFLKVQNNINQFAKHANTQQRVGEASLREFNELLKQVQIFKIPTSPELNMRTLTNDL